MSNYTLIMCIKGLLYTLPLLIAGSCTNVSESKIESAFKDYMHKNLGDPNDYLGITEIVQKDSLNLVQAANKLLEIDIDSVAAECGHILHGEIAPMGERLNEINVNNLSISKKKELREMVEETIGFIHESITRASTHADITSFRDSLNRKVKSIDPAFESNREYVIKVRIKVDGNPIIREYHAVQTAIVDSILISENEIKLTMCPKEMTEVIIMTQGYGMIVNDLLEYRNKLINLRDRFNAALESLRNK